jgi:hypothetical protein
MVRRSRAQWLEVVAKFEGSGESVAKFCARRQISPRTFAWWRWHLRAERRPAGAHENVRLVAVELAAPIAEPRAVEATVRISLAGSPSTLNLGRRGVSRTLAERPIAIGGSDVWPAVARAETPRSLALEASGVLGVAPNGIGGGSVVGAEVSIVYRASPPIGVAVSGSYWLTGGTCFDTCTFPVWGRVAPEVRWYLLHGEHVDVSLLGEVGALFASGFRTSALGGAGARGELVAPFGVLGIETRGGLTTVGGSGPTSRAAPYFVIGLSLGYRFVLR